jgi:ABC-type transporter Mla MlaB component
MKQTKRKQKATPQKSAPDPVVAEAPVIELPVAPVVTVKATDSSYALGASCTMREGAAIKADLMKLVASDQLVQIDVSAIERIDTSALQLLCAFVRDRRAKRLTTRWKGQPEAFSEAVEILGLASALGYSPGQRAS